MRYFGWMIPLYEEKEEGTDGTSGNSKESSKDGENESEDNETSDEEHEENDKGNEDDLPEEELKEAKALFKLIKDPTTQKETLRVMAEKAGIKLADLSPKQEAKAVKSILAILEEDLGDNLKFIAPQLAKSLEKILEQEREQQSEKFQQVETERVNASVEAAKEKLSRETKGESNKVWKQMESLADKFSPAAGVSTYDYIKMLYTLASADGQRSTIKSQMSNKIIQNSKDVGSRLQSSSTSNGKTMEKTPKTLKGIVEQQYEKLLKG